LFEEFISVLRVNGGENAKLILESADEVFQRLLFVIDIKDGKLL